MDRKTRKQLTINGSHHPKANVDRLYLERSKGGRGIISVEDCVLIESASLNKYLSSSEENLLKIAHKEGVVKRKCEETDKETVEMAHAENLTERKLHDQFHKATQDVRGDHSWDWLKSGYLKKETESTVFAAQDQAISTNNHRKVILKEDISPLCRVCGTSNETVSHILSECPALAQCEYKTWRHDLVAQAIHWKLCQKWGFEAGKTWYSHEPERVLENEDCKLLWDFPIQTDKKLDHNKPDIVCVDKKAQETLLIDPACPFDHRIVTKEGEKLTNYNKLEYELMKLWKMKKVKTIPVIVGCLSTVTKKLPDWLKAIGIDISIALLQKITLLGSCKIIRKVISTQ